MRGLKTWACAVVFAASASSALAQQTGSTTGGTGSTTGGTGSITGTSSRSTNSSGLSGNSLSGSSLSGSSMSGNSNSSNSSTNNGLSSLSQQNAQYSDIGITGTSSLQKSNVFAGFYSNPYAMGLSSSSGGGGFGQPTFGTTSSSTAGRTGATGTRTGSTGLSNSANQSGILIPLPVQIAYSAQMRFPTPPVATPRLQADLRGIIDAGGLTTPQTVQVVADAGNNVVLRGTVKDDDEKRLVEGLVRLTPGVGSITNDLTYPAASK